MVDLVSYEVRRFYKKDKNTDLINRMVYCYQELISYIDEANKGPYNELINKGLKYNIIQLNKILKSINRDLEENCDLCKYDDSDRFMSMKYLLEYNIGIQQAASEADFEEFLFVSESVIENDYYKLSKHLLKEMADGKVDLKAHLKALEACNTRKEYLDICHNYISGYYEYITNSHNTKSNVAKTKICFEIDKGALKEGYALLNSVLFDKDLTSKKEKAKFCHFRNSYFISSISINSYDNRKKTLLEMIFKNSYVSSFGWRQAGNKAYDLVINTIAKKQPEILANEVVFQKTR